MYVVNWTRIKSREIYNNISYLNAEAQKQYFIDEIQNYKIDFKEVKKDVILVSGIKFYFPISIDESLND